MALARPTPEQVAALRLRMPAAFGPTPGRRAMRAVAALAALGWIVFLFFWFQITPQRLWNGLSASAPSSC
jgi:phosphonate transport system permease protein